MKITAKKTKTKPTNKAMCVAGQVVHTDGKGLWSDVKKAVKLGKLDVAYCNFAYSFGELRAYFPKKSWDVHKLGLIYTDDLFLKEFHAALVAAGFSKKAVSSVDYSEQGMQGDNYVSFDVGEPFLQAWMARA